jgi:hypothetical protein
MKRGALKEQLLAVAEQLQVVIRAREELLNDYHRKSGVSAGSKQESFAEENKKWLT